MCLNDVLTTVVCTNLLVVFTCVGPGLGVCVTQLGVFVVYIHFVATVRANAVLGTVSFASCIIVGGVGIGVLAIGGCTTDTSTNTGICIDKVMCLGDHVLFVVATDLYVVFTCVGPGFGICVVAFCNRRFDLCPGLDHVAFAILNSVSIALVALEVSDIALCRAGSCYCILCDPVMLCRLTGLVAAVTLGVAIVIPAVLVDSRECQIGIVLILVENRTIVRIVIQSIGADGGCHIIQVHFDFGGDVILCQGYRFGFPVFLAALQDDIRAICAVFAAFFQAGGDHQFVTAVNL